MRSQTDDDIISPSNSFWKKNRIQDRSLDIFFNVMNNRTKLNKMNLKDDKINENNNKEELDEVTADNLYKTLPYFKNVDKVKSFYVDDKKKK